MSETAQEREVPKGYNEVQLGPKLEVIPSDWEIESLSNWLSSLETGGRPKTSKRSESDSVLSIGGAHITDGSFDLDDPVRISEAYYQELNSGKIEEADILLVKDGATIGKSTYVERVPEGCAAVNSHVYILRVNHNQYDPRFLYNFIKSKTGLDQILRLTTGTAQAGLNRTFQQATKVPTPSLSEQHRIADILSTVDDQIQQTDEIIQETKGLKRGLMQDLYTRGTEGDREMQSTRIGEIPDNWDLATIDQHAEVVSGTHVKSDLVSDDDSLTPYITGPSDFTRNGIQVSKYTDSPSSFCDIGDILVTVKGMSCGKSTFADSSVSISRQLKAVRPGTNLDEKYLFYWIRYKEQLLYVLAQGTRQLGLSTSDLTTLPIPVPPYEEQEQIGDILSKVDKKINEEIQSKQDLEALKRGLMQDLFTGKVRVDAD